jgi:hypothetical protein
MRKDDATGKKGYYDEAHGAALIDASARYGRGLPAHVIPVQINEPSQIGPEIMAAALAWGADGVRVLAKDRPAHPLDGLETTRDLMAVIGAAIGLGAVLLALLQWVGAGSASGRAMKQESVKTLNTSSRPLP